MHKLSFITRTSKTAMSKEVTFLPLAYFIIYILLLKLVLKNPDVKNSWVREYLPDRDLIKIQEDESQEHDDNNEKSKIILPRFFNP